MFRNLSPEEEAEFRQWARENWEPNHPEWPRVNPLWHPVIQDEVDKMWKEYQPFECFR